jgi:hypothetical protein
MEKGRLEAVDQQQRYCVALLQHITEFKGPIRRIDGHKDDANAGRGELQHDPLRHIRGPQSHMFSGPNAIGP